MTPRSARGPIRDRVGGLQPQVHPVVNMVDLADAEPVVLVVRGRVVAGELEPSPFFEPVHRPEKRSWKWTRSENTWNMLAVGPDDLDSSSAGGGRAQTRLLVPGRSRSGGKSVAVWCQAQTLGSMGFGWLGCDASFSLGAPCQLLQTNCHSSAEMRRHVSIEMPDSTIGSSSVPA
jgi:hypothetical protein